jgi:hypothetical protein
MSWRTCRRLDERGRSGRWQGMRARRRCPWSATLGCCADGAARRAQPRRGSERDDAVHQPPDRLADGRAVEPRATAGLGAEHLVAHRVIDRPPGRPATTGRSRRRIPGCWRSDSTSGSITHTLSPVRPWRADLGRTSRSGSFAQGTDDQLSDSRRPGRQRRARTVDDALSARSAPSGAARHGGRRRPPRPAHRHGACRLHAAGSPVAPRDRL